jgi:hypothetical protein
VSLHEVLTVVVEQEAAEIESLPMLLADKAGRLTKNLIYSHVLNRKNYSKLREPEAPCMTASLV